MRESEVCIAFSAFVRGLMNDVLCISGSSSSTPWPFVPSCGDSIYKRKNTNKRQGRVAKPTEKVRIMTMTAILNLGGRNDKIDRKTMQKRNSTRNK